MNTFKHLTPWGVKTLRLQKLQYAKGGTLAVAAEELTENGTWEPWAVLTVNVPAIAGEKGADDEHAFLDTNNGDGWWVRKFLEKYGLAEDTGIRTVSDYCTYPLYRWHTEKF